MPVVYSTARSIAYLADPASASIVDGVVLALTALFTYLKDQARWRNEELNALLDAFFDRMECEKAARRNPNSQWVEQFDSLVTDIYAYVEACERKRALDKILCAIKSSSKVAAFKKRIDLLCAEAGTAFQ